MEKKAIALACRMDSKQAINLTKEIFNYLKDKGEIVVTETRIAPRIVPHSGKDLITMTEENTKVIVCVGGDGSLLRVSQSLPQMESPPILGVNFGSVGFLDESNEKSILSDLDKVLVGDYTLENCSKITPYLVKSNSEQIKLQNALNEVLVVSSKHSKVLQIAIKVNGVYLNRSYLDGVIISTSTGSTAYNLSAGGAIVCPRLRIMQLTPLNPFARSGLKPLILPIDSEIEIDLIRPRLNARIIIDGQITIKKIQPNTKIIIRKANTDAKFIRFTESYFKRLREKIIGTLDVPLSDSPEE